MRIKFRQEYEGPAGSFSPGDIANLNKDIAINICNAGLAFPVKERQIENQVKDLGGGWYETSNGEKIRGKDKAIKAEKEVN